MGTCSYKSVGTFATFRERSRRQFLAKFSGHYHYAGFCVMCNVRWKLFSSAGKASHIKNVQEMTTFKSKTLPLLFKAKLHLYLKHVTFSLLVQYLCVLFFPDLVYLRTEDASKHTPSGRTLGRVFYVACSLFFCRSCVNNALSGSRNLT